MGIARLAFKTGEKNTAPTFHGVLSDNLLTVLVATFEITTLIAIMCVSICCRWNAPRRTEDAVRAVTPRLPQESLQLPSQSHGVAKIPFIPTPRQMGILWKLPLCFFNISITFLKLRFFRQGKNIMGWGIFVINPCGQTVVMGRESGVVPHKYKNMWRRGISDRN